MGLHGVNVDRVDQVSDGLKECLEQQKNGKSSVLEIMVSRHLGEPFRRDAMKLPKRHLEKYKGDIVLEESSTGQPTDMDKYSNL